MKLQAKSTATLHIDSLSHEGRGIASYDQSFGDAFGKKVFVSFALPNETVKVAITHHKKSYDEGFAIDVVANPHPHRQAPVCAKFGVCGGCGLQHYDTQSQIALKQATLQNQLARHGITPKAWLNPIRGETLAYRTKARLGVRYLPKTAQLVLGFREKNSNFLTDISTCPVLDKRLDGWLEPLRGVLADLDGKDVITHLELATGDDLPCNVAMVVRHVKPLNRKDKAKLLAFCQKADWQLYLQPKGADSLYRFDKDDDQGLRYRLVDFDGLGGVVDFCFLPTDFTQVNLSINRQMVKQAMMLLDLKKGERVLDLFCGLGNFSLPMAKMVGQTGQVVGVEGGDEMVGRARRNALMNGLENVQFFAQDLTRDFSHESWVGQVDALLIDPPRTGASEVMTYLGRFDAKRIVYVSCDVATLARDSQKLIEQGYTMTHAGVMDMFTHTAHVESMVRFERT